MPLNPININNYKIIDSNKLQKDFIMDSNCRDSNKTYDDPLKETACFKFMKQDQPEFPIIIKQTKFDGIENFNKKTLDNITLKQKVLIAPTTPHQKASFDNRRDHDRKTVLSENQLHRNNVYNPMNVKYKERIVNQNEKLKSKNPIAINIGI